MCQPQGQLEPLKANASGNWFELHHREGGMEQVAKARYRKGDLEGGVQNQGLGLDQ